LLNKPWTNNIRRISHYNHSSYTSCELLPHWGYYTTTTI